jgi:hypothetical protein
MISATITLHALYLHISHMTNDFVAYAMPQNIKQKMQTEPKTTQEKYIND